MKMRADGCLAIATTLSPSERRGYSRAREKEGRSQASLSHHVPASVSSPQTGTSDEISISTVLYVYGAQLLVCDTHVGSRWQWNTINKLSGKQTRTNCH